jgi:hypothetical protein
MIHWESRLIYDMHYHGKIKRMGVQIITEASHDAVLGTMQNGDGVPSAGGIMGGKTETDKPAANWTGRIPASSSHFADFLPNSEAGTPYIEAVQSRSKASSTGKLR